MHAKRNIHDVFGDHGLRFCRVRNGFTRNASAGDRNLKAQIVQSFRDKTKCAEGAGRAV